MRIGIFARTFARPSLDQVLAAVRRQGLAVVHFNLSCAGLESLPASLDPETCRHIRSAFERHALEMAAVSGTFNAIHPNLARRREGIDRCRQLIASCPDLGTAMVSLCSGTRDAHDMWREHPDNSTPAARADLIATIRELLPVAERHGVTLGIEPETANVIDSGRTAREFLDEMGTDRLKIIFDPANLVKGRDPAAMGRLIEDAFELLGPDIVMAHAKELAPDRSHKLPAPGSGMLDWKTCFRLLRSLDRNIPIVMHGLEEADVPSAIVFLQQGLGMPAHGKT